MKRLLILHNDLHYFLSHRLGVVRAIRASGWQVEIAVPNHVRRHELRDEGLKWHLVELIRGRATPLADSRYIRDVVRLLRERTPDLVHAYSIKPILLGSLALRLQHNSKGRHIPLVATVSGLGIVFQMHQTSMLSRLRRAIVEQLYRISARYEPSIFTFEHTADLDFFRTRLGLVADRGAVLPGAGIDLNAYQVRGRSHRKFRVLFAARLLRSKGVLEFIQAATRTRGDDIEWLIAGAPDPDNDDSLSEEEVRGLGGPSVSFLGHINDMRHLLSNVDAVALPSRYPEGIPRILIEAAASGVVPIASDFPGSRALIEDEDSGIILQEPLAQSLASAVRRLASNRALRERLGAGARRRLETGGFDERLIAERFLQIYDGLADSSNCANSRHLLAS
jgi:glycosyltransferase involved in cell wall biosynthesis